MPLIRAPVRATIHYHNASNGRAAGALLHRRPGFNVFVSILVFALVLSSALVGCAGNTRPQAATYTVKRGDTLYSIAARHKLDYHDLARWNRLPADFAIYPGQVLRLNPSSGARVPSKTPNAGGSVTPSSSKASSKRARPVSPAPIPPEEQVARWIWPVSGQFTVRPAAPIAAASLLLLAAEGREIRAAAPGKVVYTGSGLRGFGQLVIIKHSAVFLSAYGHNRAVKVKDGEVVSAGQAIGEMGLGPGQQPALYFEIRINGQPVDPLLYLPKR